MSKNSKISALKPHFRRIMPKLVIANDAQYGGPQADNASPTAAIAMAAISKANRMKQNRAVDQDGMPVQQHYGVHGRQDWLTMGQTLHQKVPRARDNSLNAVCDTLAGYALYVINQIINFRGTFELFMNPRPTDHHFVVVDRKQNSDVNDCHTWGKNCFVIDLWHAKRDQTAILRGCIWTSWDNIYAHGIFKYPQEHLYSGANYAKNSEYSWTK